MTRVYATSVTKGIGHGESRNEEIVVIRFRTWMGWTSTYEMDKDTYELIGREMEWNTKKGGK